MKRACSVSRRGRALVMVTVAVAAVSSGCGRGTLPANLPMNRAGAWQVGAANDPDPARVGTNVLTVVVRDSSGAPMAGTIDVIVSMQAMGAMPRMESRGNVKPAGAGRFRASYGIAMAGEWGVTVRVRPANGPAAEAQYRLSTSVRGVAFDGGTPPTGTPATPVAGATPMSADSTAGAVMIDGARRQYLGIRTEPVQVRDLSTTLRVPGRVTYDEEHQAEVSLKFSGWVRHLSANVTGQPVRRGQILFTVYSPELWSAQQEYLEALRSAREDTARTAMAGASADLARAARERLSLWDVSAADIDAIARSGTPLQAVPMRSPASGVVTEKNVVLGSAFQASQVLFRIAGLDPVWVVASVPQQSAGLVRQGMSAVIRDSYRDAGARRGVVSFVNPAVDSMTRSAEVRISTANPGGRLQPGSFVEVELTTPARRSLAVPESAVLPTGERHVVFVDLGDGRLAPREVQLGPKAGGYYEVERGLRAGEVVVTSGNFLVAAESKLRSAAQPVVSPR